jgi:hypothetical protein
MDELARLEWPSSKNADLGSCEHESAIVLDYLNLGTQFDWALIL